MSLLDDLISDTRKRMEKVADNAPTRDLGDLIDRTCRKLSDRTLENICLPVSDVYDRKTRNMSNSEYNDFIDKYSRIIAGAAIWEVIDQARLVNDLSRSEEREYLNDVEDYNNIVKDSGRDRGGRDRDLDRGRDRDRDDRGRDRERRRDKTTNDRHTGNYEREGDEDRSNRNDRDRNRDDDKKQTSKPTAPKTLADGETITSKNWYLLPAIAKDVPFYYAGLEAIVFNPDSNKVNLSILDGDSKVNYEKHRTDVYLDPNREVKSVGMSIENINKRMQEAALNKIKAFAKDESENKSNEEQNIVAVKIDKDLIIDGIYQLPETILGREDYVRQEVLDVFNNADVLDKVIGITVSHEISPLNLVDTESEEYRSFIDLVNTLSVETKLSDIRTILKLASGLFTPAEYDVIHRIYNQAVCNALSVSLKLGIRTNSIVRDWNDIEKLINNHYTNNPNIIQVIDMNLCAAIPTIFEDDGLRMIRNYIFMPISKNELSISSPVNYATLNQSQRPEFYNVVNKLLTTNVPQDTFKPFTTVVTNDNAVIPLFKNRSLVSDAGYYIFKPI